MKLDILKDPVLRRSLLAFLRRSIPKKGADGRIGLVIAQSWLEGYDRGLRRGRRS